MATLPIYATLPEGAEPRTRTSAKSVTTTPDGMSLIFTDSPARRFGFVDIADPAAPKPAGSLALAGIEPQPLGADLPVLEKSMAVDLLREMLATKGWISDKPEGLALLASGELIAVTDNDGVEDVTGETLLLRLGRPQITN
ncbi:MAG: hypothetical protein AB7I59_05260 [Geminicoccaceae bacterium]